jgi:hypothetical protein
MVITCVTCRYLPNLRYLARLCEVDKAVILDLAPLPHQYKNSFISRNRICTKTGDLLWLSVPVSRKGVKYISDAKIDSTRHNWMEKHLNAIAHTYPRHEHIAKGFLNNLNDVLHQSNGSLIDLNLQSSKYIIKLLQLDCINLVMQSSIMNEHNKNHRIEVAKALAATEYVAGRVECNVMEKSGCIERMVLSGINVFISPELDQRSFPVDIVEKLSCVHAICTIGPEKTRDLIYKMALYLKSNHI